MKIKLVLLVTLIFTYLNIIHADQTDDFFTKTDFKEENLKPIPVTFNLGGLITTKASILLGQNNKYFTGDSDVLSPKDGWYANAEANILGTIHFESERFLLMNIKGIFNFTNNKILPLLNVEELYLNWKYPNGLLQIGRTYYSLSSRLIFSGPLDGLQITVDAPYLNFKSFLGFTGFLGLFNPYFNPYNITDYDNSYVEETNLIDLQMHVKLNNKQSRRVFFGMDFDINFFGQNMIPYFLVQYDTSAIALPEFSNKDYTLSTFNIGLQSEGRIFTNFFYMTNFSGVFGGIQDVNTSVSKSIAAFAMQAELKYVIPKTNILAFAINYSMSPGTQNDSEPIEDENIDKTEIRKFYYYGDFNGGFVLDPILTNIHNISFKLLFTPIKKFTFYSSIFQTFKFYPESTISDPKAINNDYIVGTEVDLGLMLGIGSNFTFALDSGLFFPQSAYQDNTPRLKVGGNISFKF